MKIVPLMDSLGQNRVRIRIRNNQDLRNDKLPNVGDDSCGKIARAEDSQHGTVGIESDVFLYGSLRTAKEEPLDCNDDESTLSNRIKERVLFYATTRSQLKNTRKSTTRTNNRIDSFLLQNY